VNEADPPASEPILANGQMALEPTGERGVKDACWSVVGVHGDGTCPELHQYIRCRNCPVYSQAAIQLLDRPMPVEFRRQWTAHFAGQKDQPPPAKGSAVIFRLGAEWFALPTQAFVEVAEKRRIQSLPHRRQSLVLGVVNHRGEILVCVSLAHLLNLEGLPSRESVRANSQRLLVLAWDGNRFALPVEEVEGIQRYHPEELHPPGAAAARSAVSFARGILQSGDKTIAVLEPETLFATLNRSLA
jgi:chemotaxis-related protein WspD